MKAYIVAALVLSLLASSCGESADGRQVGATDAGGRILVAAAADLRFAFQEMRPLFEQQCGCRVEMAFGSSGNFVTQIEQGFPADVFFSANADFVDSLESKALTLPGTKQPYAIGRIVLAKNRGVTTSVETLQDLMAPGIRRVSIANPVHAPYGVAAQEALARAGLWEAIQPKLVFGENVSQATQFVESGDAQAGILPLSLAIQLQDKLSYVLIDESQHTRLSQSAAVLKRSDNPELARRFLAFVTGPQGRAIMEKYGFLAPA